MKRLEAIGLALVVCSAALIAVTTGSYSTAVSDRGSSVYVADESDAYLEVQTTDATVTSAGWTDVELGWVVNNLAGDITSIDIDSSGSGAGSGPPTVRDVSVSSTNSLGTGESRGVVATVRCGNGTIASEIVTLDIDAAGVNNRVSTTETVQITCDVAPQETETATPPGVVSGRLR